MDAIADLFTNDDEVSQAYLQLPWIRCILLCYRCHWNPLQGILRAYKDVK